MALSKQEETPPGPEPVCGAFNRTGGFVYRPWYDKAVLPFVARLLFPLSRAWAAANAVPVDAADPVSAFLNAVPDWRGNRRFIAKAVRATMASAARYREAEARWQSLAFAEDGPASDETQKAYRDLRIAMTRWMGCRWKFLPAYLRTRFPAVHADVAPPDEAINAQLSYLDTLVSPPAIEPAVTSWHRFGKLARHRWIAVDSPTPFDGQDRFWAQYLEPLEGPIRGTIILAHGIAMEEEFWLGVSPVSRRLLKDGFALVLPDGPAHARRMVSGYYGGEPAMIGGPVTFTHYLNAHARELGSLIAWTRREGTAPGPLLLAGVSLGALTVQTLLSKGAGWEDPAMLPDAALLITACDHFASILEEGRLAVDTGLLDSVRAAGWTDEHIAASALHMNPADHPALPAARIGVLLGSHDVILPIRYGHALADRWAIPEDNVFLRRQGHFSASLGLAHAPDPFHVMMNKAKC